MKISLLNKLFCSVLFFLFNFSLFVYSTSKASIFCSDFLNNEQRVRKKCFN